MPTVTQINEESTLINSSEKGTRVRRKRAPRKALASRASNMVTDKCQQTELSLVLALQKSRSGVGCIG